MAGYRAKTSEEYQTEIACRIVVTERRIREVELLQLVRVSEEITNSAMSLSIHHDGGRPSMGIPEVLDTETSIAEI
jgi:hypothetical protein